MKKGLLRISFSGAKEQARTYRNGSTVAMAKHPSNRQLMLSNSIDCQDLFIFMISPLIRELAWGFPEQSL